MAKLLRVLVAGPITPAPGSLVEARLGFQDLNDNAIGPSANVTVAQPAARPCGSALLLLRQLSATPP
jgi:hypothetical protein